MEPGHGGADTVAGPSLPRLVRLAVGACRPLLRTFPSSFRERHAAPLVQNAADLLAAEHARGGAGSTFFLWLRLSRDLVTNGLAERAHNRLVLPPNEQLPMLDTLLLDLRFARRALARRPGLTALAALTLALGVGASASMFSVVDGVLLKPLPYPDAERLMTVFVTIPEWEGHESYDRMAREARWSYEEFVDFYERQESFRYAALLGGAAGNLTGLGDAERTQIGLAGLDLFTMLGATPAAGRFFDPADAASDGHVTVVSWSFWQERLGGNADAVGSTLNIGGDPYQVVGVLPEGFAVSSSTPYPLWIPVFSNRPGGFFPGNTGDMNHVFGAMAMLNEGVTPDMAADETGRLLRAVGGPDHFTQHGANVVSRLERMVGPARAPLFLLMGAAVLVLLVACGNVATFLLGQAVDRQHEMAIRGAIGAGRKRIARQLLTESVLLGSVAGVLGIGIAWFGVRALTAIAPAEVPRMAYVALDGRALAFALGVSLLSGLLFGLAPALTLARTDLSGALGAERFGSAGRSRLQATMVVAEVAAATILLIGAGLLTRSFISANSIDSGFQPEGVLTLMARPESSRFVDAEGEYVPAAERAYYQRLQDEIAAIPGVEAVALAQVLPFSRSYANNTITPEGYEGEDAHMLLGQRRLVSPNFLPLMGARLLDGRHLEPADDVEEAASVVVVTNSIASRFWPGESAVGKKLFWWGQESVIVGVVADIHDRDLTEDVGMQFYASMTLFGQAGGSLVIRTNGDPSAFAGQVRDVVRAVDSDLPIIALTPLTARISESLANSRYRVRLIGVFAIAASLLAVLGLYGVTARAVAARTREVGIRLALGAVRGDVISMVLRQGTRLALVGTGLGLVVSLMGTRFLEGQLFGVEPNDPMTLAAIVVVVASLSILAALVPALRASRVDPVEALRSD
jgi:predicted permease